MFKSLKDKLKGFFGKPEEKEEKPKKETKEKAIPKSKGKEKASKTGKKSAKDAKPKGAGKKAQKKLPSDNQLKKQAEQIQREVPKKFSNSNLQYLPDTETIEQDKDKIDDVGIIPKEEKKSFFSKLFRTKEPEIDEIDKIEEKRDEEKVGEKPSFLKRFTSRLNTTTLQQEHVDEIFEPLELILLENNVNLNVVDKIKENLSKDLVGIEVKKDKIESTILRSLKDSISSIFIEPPDLINMIKNKNRTGDIYTIIFFGINGSGKTTSIAKLAHKLMKEGISCVLAAGDTFRAASIEQLKVHGQRLNMPVIAHDYGSDPAAVAFDAKSYALKNKINCVLIDTAGRMYTRSNLMKEMEKIIRVSNPDFKMFVAESITGNDATSQAETFNESVGIDGIILTKADVDEKGGAILSVGYTTKKPVLFLGIGQSYEDLEKFNKEKLLKNLGI